MTHALIGLANMVSVSGCYSCFLCVDQNGEWKEISKDGRCSIRNTDLRKYSCMVKERIMYSIRVLFLGCFSSIEHLSMVVYMNIC